MVYLQLVYGCKKQDPMSHPTILDQHIICLQAQRYSCYLSPCFIVFNFSISSLTWSRFQSAILSVPDTSWTCSSVNPCFLRLAQNPCQLIGLSCLLYTSPSPRDS